MITLELAQDQRQQDQAANYAEIMFDYGVTDAIEGREADSDNEDYMNGYAHGLAIATSQPIATPAYSADEEF